MRVMYEFCGGRKQFNGYVFVIAATIMAFPLDATFVEWAGAVGAVLVGTNLAIAHEDRGRP